MPYGKGKSKRLKAPKGAVKVQDILPQRNPTVEALRGRTGGGIHKGSKAEQVKRACRDKKGRGFVDSGLFVLDDKD